MIAWLWLAVAHGGECTFTVDGVPTARLDCSSPGAWRVSCSIPEGRSGKLRTRMRIPSRGLEGEARVPLSASGELDLPLKGPGGRAGAFAVRRAVAGLLPGQAVGPMQFCPVVQPGVAPGSAPRELTIEVWVSEHAQTGFAEEALDGGVVNRVPVYDEGRSAADGRAVVVQLPVKDVPILEGTLPLLRDEAVKGELRLRSGEVWSTLAWSGTLRDEVVDTGDLVVLVVDFATAAVSAAMGPGQPTELMEADLRQWLAGSHDSRLGLAAWRRSEIRVPPSGSTPGFDSATRDGIPWRIASLGNAEIRVGQWNDVVRVVIARRAAPLDGLALATIDRISGAR